MAREAPPFVDYRCVCDYFGHYVREYCHKKIVTPDGIRVHFRSDTFGHAFFEDNDTRFSEERAMRIDWIGYALTNPATQHLFGWDKNRGCDDFTRRVAVIGQFVVVLLLKLDRPQQLKAEFLTCFPAKRRTLEKILKSAAWSKSLAIEELRSKRKERREAEMRGRGRRGKKKGER